MRNWTIRGAEAADATAIALVHIRSWQETYRGQVPDSYLDSLDQDVEQRRQVWRQADGEIVGFISVGPTRDDGLDPQKIGELGVIYLRQKHWGLGIGKSLHDEGMGRLRTFGFKEAMLWVLDTNTRTRKWYERQGWQVDGASKSDDRGDFVLNEVRYRLDLSNLC